MKRAIVAALFAVGLILAGIAAVQGAYQAAALPIRPALRGGAVLLFDSSAWVIWVALFLGFLAAGLTRRSDPAIVGDRVLRHDGPAILEHWSHAAATLTLLVTGVALGARYLLPKLVSGPVETGVALNLHFVGAALFAFAAGYYAPNTLLSGRWREHIPHEIVGSVKLFFAHYKAIFTRSELPAEGKYFAIEHLTYPVAIAGSVLVLITGLLKVVAHSLDIPAGVMGATTLVHDISAIVLGGFLVAHAIAGALVPWSWPLLRSIITGYVTVEYAKHHHKDWYTELAGVEIEEDERLSA